MCIDAVNFRDRIDMHAAAAFTLFSQYFRHMRLDYKAESRRQMELQSAPK